MGANQQAQINFQQKINAYQPAGPPIVDLDESALAQDMPRRHGYSKKGTPCHGTQNWQAKGRVNAMGALMGMTFLTVVLFDGCLNWEVFYAWLTEDLLPKTAAGTVIVIVNASFHKRPDMLEAISAN